MEMISYDAFAGSEFEAIDFVSFTNAEQEFVVDLDLVTSLSYRAAEGSGGYVDKQEGDVFLVVKIKNGLGLFTDFLRKEAYNKILFTCQCSTYHGERMVFTASVLGVERDIQFPGTAIFRIRVVLPTLNIYTEFEEVGYIKRA